MRMHRDRNTGKEEPETIKSLTRVLQAGMICIWNMSRSLRFLLLIGSPPVFCFYKINTSYDYLFINFI
jgi:hypothetical protein